MSVRVLVPSGVLGLGFDREALSAAAAMKPDVICIDGGSTDSGPHSLGTSTSKYSRAACKAEWRELMRVRAQLNVPLILGSAGTCGTDAMVDWMLTITQEIAVELEQTPKVTVVYSEQNKTHLLQAWHDQQIHELQPPLPLDAETIKSCEHVVALAGAEQIQVALQTGADIVIAGRTTDTAVVSALPLMLDCHAGACWHAAKIAECGALCSTHPTSGVIIVDIDCINSTSEDSSNEQHSNNEGAGFTIYPTAKGAACTAHSVSAHMLYENADPFILYEPGGHLDVRDAKYCELDDRTVRVTGSHWVPEPVYTVKLEGARLAGYQTTAMAILRDQHYVRNARQWVERLSSFLHNELSTHLSTDSDSYHIDFRLIGDNAVLGNLETRTSQAVEIGVLVIITANTQPMADEIGKFINPFLLHYPLTDGESLPTFAFPYSPAQTSRGALYEFCLNHVMELSEPMSVFRIATHQLPLANVAQP